MTNPAAIEVGARSGVGAGPQLAVRGELAPPGGQTRSERTLAQQAWSGLFAESTGQGQKRQGAAAGANWPNWDMDERETGARDERPAVELRPGQAGMPERGTTASAISKSSAAASDWVGPGAGLANPLRSSLVEGVEGRTQSSAAADENSSDARAPAVGPVKKTRDSDAPRSAEPAAQTAAEPAPAPIAAVLAGSPPIVTGATWRPENLQAVEGEAHSAAKSGASASQGNEPAVAGPNAGTATAQSPALAGNPPSAAPPPDAAAEAGVPLDTSGESKLYASSEAGIAAHALSQRAGELTSQRRPLGTASFAAGASEQNSSSISHQGSRLAGDQQPAATSGARHEPAEGAQALASSAADTHSKLSAVPNADTPSSAIHQPAAAPGAASATPTHPATVSVGAGIAPSREASGIATTSPVGTANVFTALDSGTGVGAPTLIHAGGHRAEAGFEDPALGWVGVRVGVASSGIHAAVVPASTEAAQALDAHLAGMASYLSEQHLPVSSLTMAAAEPNGFASGMDGGRQESTGQNDGQSNPAAPQPSEPPAEDGASMMNAKIHADASSEPADYLSVDGWRGSRISVVV